ncbi:ORF6N domain-containing protein, partial [bacterium]|nr:ORF6N domain-containing protein [bacterium]
MAEIIPFERIEQKIYFIRGKKVMLDRDLAELYGVTTKALNQGVKRNKGRFPADFMYQLSDAEKDELVTNCDRLQNIKHSSVLPYVFTENGVAMLSSVLKSARAVRINIQIMRTFTKLRELISMNKDLFQRLNRYDAHLAKHDKEIANV